MIYSTLNDRGAFSQEYRGYRLPKPHGKGANAEVGTVAGVLLATQITFVLLSLCCGVLFILIKIFY